MNKYTWIVTKDEVAGEASDSIGKIGPPGGGANYRFDRVISGGAEFRLLDREGTPKFCGFILGAYDGHEPLTEYGVQLGCVAIEYKRDGRWKPHGVELSTQDLSGTGIRHFATR